MSDCPDNNSFKKRGLREEINEILQKKIDVNRKYVDEILEKVWEQNRQYYLERLGYELREMELASTKGNLISASHHQVMAHTYKSILERSFAYSR
ncbi:MAG TPA: hypothetical protein VGQ13_07685 [Nitrososphaera sp.]|nr:hypothetical protein [Nitrososphaera sp.]